MHGSRRLTRRDLLWGMGGKLFWNCNFSNFSSKAQGSGYKVVKLPETGRMTVAHYHNKDLQEAQWLNSDAQIFSTDLSHINLPPLAHVELSSAVFTLPLSFWSALRVISSAIWSIASQIKNALRMTNLITPSQKYGAAHNWGQTWVNV